MLGNRLATIALPDPAPEDPGPNPEEPAPNPDPGKLGQTHLTSKISPYLIIMFTGNKLPLLPPKRPASPKLLPPKLSPARMPQTSLRIVILGDYHSQTPSQCLANPYALQHWAQP